MNNIKSFVSDLQKNLTLDEIAAKTSVSRERLTRYSKSETIQPSYKNSKAIIKLWCGVCNGR